MVRERGTVGNSVYRINFHSTDKESARTRKVKLLPTDDTMSVSLYTMVNGTTQQRDIVRGGSQCRTEFHNIPSSPACAVIASLRSIFQKRALPH